MFSRFHALTHRNGAKAFVLVVVMFATVLSIGASFVHTNNNANAANANSPKALSSGMSMRVAAHGTIDLSKAPKLPANTAQPTHRPLTNLPLPAAARAKSVGLKAGIPSAVTEAKALASTGANFVGGGTTPLLGANANGLNSTQAGGWYPPDQAIGVGGAGAAVNQYVVEGVNNAVAIYNTNMGLVAGPYSSDTIFASVKVNGDFFSDPQITYDADRVHWVIVYLELTPGQTASGVTHGYIDVAISNGIYPTGIPSNYNVYRFDINLSSGTTEWCDYPTLGMEYWNLYVSCATFDTGGNFIGNRVFMFAKTDLINGSGSPHWGWFFNIPTSVSCGTNCLQPAYRLAPATENGVPNAEYVVATDAGYLGSNVSGNATVTAITNPRGLGLGTLPTATAIIGSLPAGYTDPIAVPQSGTSATVYSGIGIKQFMYKGGYLWISFTTQVNWNGDNATRDGVYWTQIEPSLSTVAAHNPQYIAGFSAHQQGYWGYVGKYTFMPSIQPDDEGDASLVFNYSSSSDFPSIVFTGRKGDDALGTMGQGNSSYVAVGSNPNGSGRWGDYSACALNVHPTSRGYAFCAGEYAGSHASAAGTGWDTYMYVLRTN